MKHTISKASFVAALTVAYVTAADAHTISIGYETVAANALNFWYGTYHDPSEANYNEGSFRLVWPNGSVTEIPFALLTTSKPIGLKDGDTNFYSGGSSTVLSPTNTYGQDVLAWQGVSFTGLVPGTYTFTYVPIASPTQVWAPTNDAVLSNSVTLIRADLADPSTPRITAGETVDETSPEAASDPVIFDGGTLKPTTDSTINQYVSITSPGGTIDTSDGDLTLTNEIDGRGALTKTGDGTLFITGNNTNTGGLNLNGGAVNVVNDGNLGDPNAGLTFDGGALQLGSSFDIAPTRPITLNGGGGTIDTNGYNTTIAQGITGPGSLIKEGPGTLTLSGDSTYGGGTFVNGGTLDVDGSLTSGVLVNNGGSLAGDGTINGGVTVADGGHLVGTSGQTLSMDDLILNGGSVIDATIGAPTSTPLFDVGGNLTLDGTLNIAQGPGFDVGITRLFDYGGTLTDNGLAIGAVPGGASPADFSVQTAVGGQVNLVNSAGAGLNFWDGGAVSNLNNGAIDGGNGTWSASSQAWTDANGRVTSPMKPQPGFAIFMGNAGNVTVDGSAGPVGVTGMQFAVNGYTINGDSVTLSQPQTVIRVGDGTAAGAGYTATIGSALTGSGGLVKTDLGTLILGGTNTYTGATVVKGGTLQLAGALNPATDLVVDGGTFDLGSRSQTVAGLSGAGGTIALGGGTLTVDQTGDSVSAGALSGTGTFVKAGSGELSLTGNSPFAGTTLVDAGTLSVNGSLANSAVTVAAGGTLGGNGIVGGIVAQAKGIVAPGGNSIGQLNVAGPVTFQSGSIYQVHVNAAGQNDRIAASGRAVLRGGTVQVLAAQGNYAPMTTYTILAARDGVSGRFAGVTSNLAFLDPSLRYGPNAVQLTMQRNDISFADVTRTPNQTAAAGATEALGSGNPIYDALLQLDAGTARTAFNQLSGEIHASTMGSLLEESRLVRHAVTDRLVEGMSPITVPAAYAADLPTAKAPTTVPIPAALSPQFGFWGQGFGNWGEIERTANTAKAERSMGGFLLGLDGGVGDNWRVGVAGGYSSSTVDVDALHSSAEIDSYHGAIYGGTRFGNFALRLGGAYAWHDIDTNRVVAFPGFSDSLRADYRARTGQVFGELGYTLSLASISLEPFAGLAYVNIDSDSFRELGGAAALTGLGGSQDVTYSTLGLRFASTFATWDTTALKAKGMIGWRHAFDDVNPAAQLAFAAGSPFTVSGAPLAENSLVIETELGMDIGTNLSLGVSYDGQLAEDVQDHAVKGNFTVRF